LIAVKPTESKAHLFLDSIMDLISLSHKLGCNPIYCFRSSFSASFCITTEPRHLRQWRPQWQEPEEQAAADLAK
jgi:hypothetical protein